MGGNAPSLRLDIDLARRGVAVALTYGLAAVAVLGTVFLLRGALSLAALRGLLAFFFIASLSSGLEPATAKAAALSGTALPGAIECLCVAALKGLLVSPAIALVWRLIDPTVSVQVLIWAPLVTVAGFCATDLRVLLDLRGRHALAITLKQGSLAGGLVFLGLLTAGGTPLGLAIGVSTLARLVWVALAALLIPRSVAVGGLLGRVTRLLTDVRWLELAGVSAIAATSGSADRAFGLRFLSPAAYGGYFLIYESLSKFWLLPYLLTPILFARRAAGGETDGFIAGAWKLTGAAGAGFLALVAAAVFIAPDRLARLVGVAVGPTSLIFAAAVVAGAFTQLRVAELQGAGASRRALAATAASAVFSLALFYLAARWFGADGLLVAWLVKSLVELASTYVPPRFFARTALP